LFALPSAPRPFGCQSFTIPFAWSTRGASGG
jgi:hypothetical protein